MSYSSIEQSYQTIGSIYQCLREPHRMLGVGEWNCWSVAQEERRPGTELPGRGSGAFGEGFLPNGDATEVGGAPLTAIDAGTPEKVAGLLRRAETGEKFRQEEGRRLRSLEWGQVTGPRDDRQASAGKSIGQRARQRRRGELIVLSDQDQ